MLVSGQLIQYMVCKLPQTLHYAYGWYNLTGVHITYNDFCKAYGN